MLHFHQRDTENPDLKTLHMAFPMEKKIIRLWLSSLHTQLSMCTERTGPFFSFVMDIFF